jgi:hypothetical protein
MTGPAYFSRRYRNAIIAAIVGWALVAPFLVFHEWILPQAYQRYVERVQAVQRTQTKKDFLAGATRIGPPAPAPKVETISPELFDDTNLDGTPLSFNDWISDDSGHPTYYTTLYNVGLPMVWVAIMASMSLLWYFCLRRIAELVGLFPR